MIVQHFVGFLLCLPAICNWVEPHLGAVLACYAAILEMAFEWQDYLKRLYVHFMTEHGEIMEPKVSLIIFGAHHTLSLLAIPMNLYYYDSYYYWCMVSTMQFAAAVAYIATEYTYMLDVKTTSGLL
jgi:hypothetical protein